MSTPEATLAAREWRLALKIEALTLINGGHKPKCACPGCDIDAPEFLACDHIHGDGKIHRELFRLGTGGAKLWAWVRDNWGVLAPAGPMGMFQALCHNCNVSKFNHPECALAGRRHSGSPVPQATHAQ